MNEVLIELIRALGLIMTPVLLLYLNKRSSKKLETIHTLVNSNMREALLSDLDATVRDLASMKEVVALRQENGQKPSQVTIKAIHEAELKINELKEKLGLVE